MSGREHRARAAEPHAGAFSDRDSILFELADRTLLPKQGDVEKIVALRMASGRVSLLIYDRLTEPLIVVDLDEHEVHLLRQVLARVTRMV